MSRKRDDELIRRCTAGGGANTDEVVAAICRRLLALEAEAGDPKRWEVTQTTVELARLKDKQT